MPPNGHCLRLVGVAAYYLAGVLAQDPVHGARPLNTSLLPLRVEGRFVVDKYNQRVKWACVNWHGLEQTYGVLGGLDTRSLHDIARRVRDLGFNCVRLPLCVHSILHDPPVNNSYISKEHNPDLFKDPPMKHLDMFDRTIDVLSDAGLMTILDRHMALPGNNPSNVSLQAGLWYWPGVLSTEDNVRALEIVAERTKGKDYVVGFDLLNEPHDYGGVRLTWGDGDEKTDLHRFYTRAGKAVLKKNPNLIIIAEGMCCGKILHYLKRGPQIDLNTTEKRVVHSPHSYVFFLVTGVLETNAGGLERMDWISYPVIAWKCGALNLFVIGPLLLLEICGWRLSKKPPIGVVIWIRCVSIGLAALTSILAGVYLFMFHMMKYGVGYCSIEADEDIWPKFVSFAGLTLLFVGVVVLTIPTVYARLGFKTPRTTPLTPRTTPLTPADKSDSESESLTSGAESESEMPFEEQVAGKAISFWGSVVPKKLQNSMAFAWCVAATACLFVAVCFCGAACAYFSSQQYFDAENDHKFGFLLKDLQEYTAPVFIGEFGTGKDSDYFQKMISYIASRDLDWAYWPFNPVRPYGGKITKDGFEQGDRPEDELVEDSWSIIAKDWVSFRHAWMSERLMRIMKWPSLQTGYTIPCNRLKTPECGA